MKLQTKTGRPTAYALACGYVETYKIGEFSGRLERYPATSTYAVTVDDGRLAYSGRSLKIARNVYDRGRKLAKVIREAYA